MKYRFIFAVMVFFVAAFLQAQEAGSQVDREELEKNLKEVEFINYMGPHDVIESRGEIMSIGQSLASALSGGGFQASVSAKYRILHLTDQSEPGRLGADIFILEKNAKVDHIRNLRLILSAYLSGAYGYSGEDSMLLAEFATYYNAVFRGNISYFGERYINKVLVNISAENAGIDTHYRNWPGKTRLVIPLRAASGDGKAEAPDPFEIAGPDVVEDLRRDEGMGIEPRKKIVELQEDELAAEKEELARKEESVAGAEEKIEEREKAVEEKVSEAEKKAASGEITEDEKREVLEEAEKEKAAIEEEKKELVAEREKTESAREEIEAREESVAKERELIASDTQKVLDEEKKDGQLSLSSAVSETTEIPFLKLGEGSGERTGRFVFYNPVKGSAVVPDNAPAVSGRMYAEAAGRYLAPVEDGPDRFVLAILSPELLEPEAKSAEEVWGRSFVLTAGSDIYCVAKNNGSWVVARYGQDMKAMAFSASAADPDTFIVKSGDRVLYQGVDGGIVSVNAMTLE